MKRVIGLCGCSGAGKSTVAALLEEKGAERIDVDEISREVSAPGGTAYAGLRQEFPDFFDEAGKLMRRKLGALVFSDPEALARLESVTHPAMRERVRERIAASEKRTVILDCAVLDRPAFRDLAGEIWMVDAPAEERIRRIMERDGLSEEDARGRAGAQDEEALRRIADRIIDNSGAPGALELDA